MIDPTDERYKEVIKVYDIFKEHFGEDKVDLGKSEDSVPFILVWWPKVRVTNEYDMYVDIKDLYAKVYVDLDGTITGFKLNRATYSWRHFVKNYMHSHIKGIPKGDFSRFESPCLGTGPIKSTMASLSKEYDEDLWKLFVLELDKYVATESLEGGPYHRLENTEIISDDSISDLMVTLTPPSGGRIDDSFSVIRKIIIEFLKYFIPLKKLKFNYCNGSYSWGLSLVDTVTIISNSFIEWYNNIASKELPYSFNGLLSMGLLDIAEISGTHILIEKKSNIDLCDYSTYVGQYVCTFKGKNVVINIEEYSEDISSNKSVILNYKLISYMIYTILNVLNFRYGKPNGENTNSTKNVTTYL